MLGLINETPITLVADDQYPTKAFVHDINKALERGRCANGGLDYVINLKKRSQSDAYN